MRLIELDKKQVMKFLDAELSCCDDLYFMRVYKTKVKNSEETVAHADLKKVMNAQVREIKEMVESDQCILVKIIE